MGHLWKRNGVWYMGYLGWEGNWKQRSCRTRYKDVAEKKLKKAELGAAYGENKPLSEFLTQYLNGRKSGLGPRGRERYEFCADILTYDHSPLAGLTLQENILELAEAQADFTCEPAVIRLTPSQMKNKTGHMVLLPPGAKDLLWRLWQGTPSRRFFLDFRPAWKRLKTKLEKDGKLKDFRFHDFRRTYVSYRIAAGVDPKTVQDEVGHKTSKMTMDTYGRALKDPGIRAWAMRHFRFPWDPEKATVTNMQEALAENGQIKGEGELHATLDKSGNL